MKTFLALFIALTSFALADGLPTEPYLFVQAGADVEKKADSVSLAFTLSATDADSVAKANAAVQTQAGKVFALLKAGGIADEDIIASDIRSDDEYEQPGGYGTKGKFLGYRVQREFTVKVRELAKFPKLVNDLFALDVRYFHGVTGEYSKVKEAEQETKELAMKKARAEADNLAKMADMKVDSVWALSSELPFPMIRDRMLNFNTSGGAAEMVAEVPGKAETAPKYAIPPVRFSLNVHVIYRISPAK
jgi:uncharacterized protein YggE